MPNLRFLGTEDSYVTPLGRVVTPDEQVEVPDDLVWSEDNPTGYVWPEAVWAEVGSGRRRTAPVNKDAATADTGSGEKTPKEG